jgi:hypothetical protein
MNEFADLIKDMENDKDDDLTVDDNAIQDAFADLDELDESIVDKKFGNSTSTNNTPRASLPIAKASRPMNSSSAASLPPGTQFEAGASSVKTKTSNDRIPSSGQVAILTAAPSQLPNKEIRVSKSSKRRRKRSCCARLICMASNCDCDAIPRYKKSPLDADTYFRRLTVEMFTFSYVCALLLRATRY